MQMTRQKKYINNPVFHLAVCRLKGVIEMMFINIFRLYFFDCCEVEGYNHVQRGFVGCDESNT